MSSLGGKPKSEISRTEGIPFWIKYDQNIILRSPLVSDKNRFMYMYTTIKYKQVTSVFKAELTLKST